MNELLIIVDSSGSMKETAKLYILRNVLHEIEQFKRLKIADFTFKIFAVNSELKEISWNVDEEFDISLIHCNKSFDANLLNNLPQAENVRYLILSDGCWSGPRNTNLRSWISRRANNTVRILKIGADYTERFETCKVFDAENIFAALDNWF